jgi:NAD(P)-dependent dehydrogenase (short-subunit alcohol dehydrogenase family)
MTARLVERVAVVTGGAQGIGGATARRLAEEGARVLIVDVDAEAMQHNLDTIHTAGGQAEALHIDVSTEEGVQRMIDQAVSRWGKLDIIVNNAYASPGPGNATEVSEDAWDHGLNVGLKSMFRAAKYGVPAMRKSGGGAMVNISSVHGLLAAPRSLVYETLKAGVIGLTRQMAVDFGPDGIRVNAICPGMIQTERMQRRWVAHPDSLPFYEQQYPVRRTGTPLDIANAVVFLCSDEASFITGHALVVDGGLTIQLQENIGVHLGKYIQEHPQTFLPG